MSDAVLLGSAILAGGRDGGALPRRRFRRPLCFSLFVHLGLVAWLLTLSVLDVGPVPPPPLTIRFFAAAPPAPLLVPLRDRKEPPPREPRRPPSRVPQPVVQAAEPALRVPRPEPIRVEPPPPPIRVPDAAPRIQIVDGAPPAGSAGAPRMAPLGAVTTPRAGTGEEPALEFLVPGEARVRGTGGGIAGRDVIPQPPAGDPRGPTRGAGAGAGGGPDGAGIASERALSVTGLASFLSRRYGVTLLEASRLGSRTTDGARYALLLPALSEAYRAIPFRGRRKGDAGEEVESVQVDADAIAIRYHDGTLHVLAPTSDGLVALFVSSRTGGTGRSKVQEAERALGVLHRCAREAAGGRAG